MWLDPDDAAHMIFGPADGVDENGRIEATVDGGASWHPVGDGLDAPWPSHMVERFVRLGDDVLAVLSNGDVITAALDRLVWQPVLPEIDHVLALAVMPGDSVS